MTSQLLSCALALIGFLCFVASAEDECKCPKLPIGQWDITFSEPVATGYRSEGTMSVDHLYNEVYYGSVVLPGYLPFQKFSMDYMGYLNGTSCNFRGSMAFVIKRHTVAFTFNYDGEYKMEGKYHRATAFSLDDHFASAEAQFKKSDLDNDLQERMLEKKPAYEMHTTTEQNVVT